MCFYLCKDFYDIDFTNCLKTHTKFFVSYKNKILFVVLSYFYLKTGTVNFFSCQKSLFVETFQMLEPDTKAFDVINGSYRKSN